MEVQKGLPGIVPQEPTQQVLPGMPEVDPMKTRYRAHGKEVLRNGVHYGDMIDEIAANCVADALNANEEQAEWAQMISRVR